MAYTVTRSCHLDLRMREPRIPGWSLGCSRTCWKSMAAYVDNMLVKSREELGHAGDLADCFQVMLKYNRRARGKISGVHDRLAALSRFVSKSADKTVPFFEAVKKKEGFAWTAECQKSFEEFKIYLSTPLVLSTPQVGEPLYLYLAALPKAVSSVLVREEERTEYPVYYVSHSLKSAETRYTPLEKVVCALAITVRKVTPYFQAHTVRVLTYQPLGSVLRNPTSSGRLVKLAVELTQYGIEYQPRPSIKGQSLADILVECTVGEDDRTSTSEESPGEWWEMHADGTSNNEVEYEAVLGGIRLAKALGVDRLRIKTDSRLVVGQVSGTCEAKSTRMTQYKEKTAELLKGFVAHEIEYISRDNNTEADILSKIALEGVPDHLVRICQKEELLGPSIEEMITEIQQVTAPEWDRDENPELFWIEDIRRYKEEGKLPADPVVDARVRRKAPSFEIIDGQLYKRSFGGPLLKCLLRTEAEKIMEEAHREICAAHQGAHTLDRKLVVQGYYWPTMMRDFIEWIAKCAVCQAFA
ncbi:PREDICTED: uncharacterized protein LOC109179233 [Ipomoea nil]|uniref:uncharacterized protein LOC109179233 n=1 Tax=Ipomoea nil TaxID=35883 RepID=UPI000900FC21|nr:PREDICTED: uncharacterized protein LOC109179233 [Ipomoea nil]